MENVKGSMREFADADIVVANGKLVKCRPQETVLVYLRDNKIVRKTAHT